MARKRERFTALFFAILFLVTSAAFSVLVIWQLATGKDPANTENTTATNQNILQGTKLANFTPLSEVPMLIKSDIVPGSGAEVKTGDTVTVDYTGAVATTGTVFQSSLDAGQPATFVLQAATPTQDGVIKGWVDGVVGMKEGGTRRLLIPADQAYGATPPPGSNIPPNAPLVFDITLRKIGN